MKGVYYFNCDLFFQLDEGGRRDHDQKLFKKRFRLNIRKYDFGNRVIDNWNSLSADCVHCKTNANLYELPTSRLLKVIV